MLLFVYWTCQHIIKLSVISIVFLVVALPPSGKKAINTGLSVVDGCIGKLNVKVMNSVSTSFLKMQCFSK